MNIEWWAGRHAGLVIPTEDRERLDQPGTGSKATAFPQLLTEASQRLETDAHTVGAAASIESRTVRIVRPGDTLSHLVQAALQQAGQRVHRGELYQAVTLVARTNRLADPDRIRPGQAIDLSVVTSGAKPKEQDAGFTHDRVAAGIGESAVSIVQGLKSFMQSFAGRLTSSFGPRTDPMTGLRAFHAGVDIKMPPGSFIYPALPGRVIFSGRTLGYGNLVILAHAGGVTTSYGHNSSNLIPAGVVVDRQMPIAIVGATGRATGPHLHFEVRKDGHPINPNVGSVDWEDREQGDKSVRTSG